MTDFGVLFTAAMITAQLEGRKTQTRRPAWGERMSRPGSAGYVPVKRTVATRWQKVQPSDRLWCREAHSFGSYSVDQAKRRYDNGQNPIVYGTDRERFKQYEAFGWRPSIHMPRWASRITWDVTAKKIERLQDILHDDCIAEGVAGSGNKWMNYASGEMEFMNAKASYKSLYESIHGKGSWDANPWVVAVTGNVRLSNIDKP